MYACRLRNLFKCCIDSRNVNSKIEDLIAVLIADRYKMSLAVDDRLYLCDKEIHGSWKTVDELAHLMDAREIERGYRVDKPRRNIGKDQRGMNTNENKFKTSYSNQSQGVRNGGYNQGYGVRTENKFSTQNRSVTAKNENGNKSFAK